MGVKATSMMHPQRLSSARSPFRSCNSFHQRHHGDGGIALAAAVTATISCSVIYAPPHCLVRGFFGQETGESNNLSQPGVARSAEAFQAIPCGSDPMDVGSSEVRLRLRVPVEQVEGGRMKLGQPPLVDRLLRLTADFERVSQCMNRFIECPFRLSPEGGVERGSKVTGDVGGATRQSLFDLSHELAAHFLACLHAGMSLLT